LICDHFQVKFEPVTLHSPSHQPLKRNVTGLAVATAAMALLGAIAGAFLFAAGGGCAGSKQGTEIFQGMIYGCEQLTPSAEGSGAIHWVRVDLSAPGIELFVTPQDPEALEQGWQYRLRWVSSVVRREKLAVAINGSLFTSAPTWRPRLPGDLARGIETVVSYHVVSHVWEHTYLLWFDDRLTPTLETTKPPSQKVLAAAKWGIGGQGVWLRNGVVREDSDRNPNTRTAVGVDSARKLLFLAVAEMISPHLMLQKLAALGAKEGMLLDGGGSTTMSLGAGARQISVGALYGGWRPVATHFGVRARTLASRN
jgi:hypothetical protein